MATSNVDLEGVRSRTPSFIQRLRLGDRLTHGVTLASAATIVILAGWVLIELFQKSALSRHQFGWKFLTSQTWNPIAGDFGALPFIYGTVMTSALALLIAVPIGVGAAMFLSELAPPAISAVLT